MPGNRSLQQQQAWEFTHQAELFHTPERVENHWGPYTHDWIADDVIYLEIVPRC